MKKTARKEQHVRARAEIDSFVKVMFGKMIAFVLGRTGRPEVAEEIVQESFASVLADEHFDVTRPDAAGYLRRRVNWLMIDYLRKPKVPQDAGDYADHRAGPERSLEMAETQESVRQAIGQLPAEQQAVIDRWLSGMKHAETAAELGMPVTQVYQLFHHAKKALRWRLQGSLAR